MAKEEILIEVVIDNEQAKKNEAELIKLIAREREELVRQRKELKKSNGTNTEAAKRIGDLTRSISINSKELRRNQNDIKAQDNSINGLRASVSKLTAERNNTNTATVEGAKRFKELTSQIKSQTDKLKELEGAAGDFRRNVGDYRNAIIEASESTGLFGGAIGDLKGAFNGVQQGLKSASLGFKGLKGAIIATGIGALLIALTSLIAFFTKTRKGAQALEKALGFIGGVTTKLINDFASLGEKIINTFLNPRKAITDFNKAALETIKETVKELGILFAGLALQIEGALTFNEAKVKAGAAAVGIAVDSMVKPFEDAGKAALDYSKDLFKAGQIGLETADTNIKLRASIRALTVTIGQQELAAEKARKARDDETKSLEERLKQNDLVDQAEEKRLEAEKKLLNARIQLIRNSDLTEKNLRDEQLQEIADFQKELAQVAADQAGRTTESQTERRNIQYEHDRLLLQSTTDRLSAELLAIDENTEAQRVKQQDILAAQLAFDILEAEQTIKNKVALDAKILLLNAEFNAAKQVLIDESIAATIAETDIIIAEIDREQKAKDDAKEKEKKRVKEVDDARKAEKETRAKAIGAQIKSDIESAKSAEEASKAVINSIRDIIKARIAEAITSAIAAEATNPNILIPLPVKLILAGAAAGAFGLLFDTLIPSFAGGGMIQPSMGVPVNHPSGDNRLIYAKTGEVILNEQQQNRIGFSALANAGVPSFAGGGVVGNVTASSVENNSGAELTSAVIAAVQALPPPVLDYSEFTTFSNTVQVRQNRAVM